MYIEYIRVPPLTDQKFSLCLNGVLENFGKRWGCTQSLRFGTLSGILDRLLFDRASPELLCYGFALRFMSGHDQSWLTCRGTGVLLSRTYIPNTLNALSCFLTIEHAHKHMQDFYCHMWCHQELKAINKGPVTQKQCLLFYRVERLWGLGSELWVCAYTTY